MPEVQLNVPSDMEALSCYWKDLLQVLSLRDLICKTLQTERSELDIRKLF